MSDARDAPPRPTDRDVVDAREASAGPQGTAGFLDALEAIVEHQGAAEYLGEEVSIAEHMIQTAVRAQADGAPDALVAAALLHDIGHLVQPDADAGDWHRHHDEVGAAFLAGHFGPEVIEPARLHVAAKRYLCAVQPEYFHLLSDASVHTLAKQGGPMSADEVRAFEANPWHADAVRLRRFEEDAKHVGRTLPRFAAFRALLERVLLAR